MTGHVFISYARTDGKSYAERLDNDLQAAGFSTWRDTRNINEYQDFSAEIEVAIRDASHLAVCVTPSLDANPSSFVRREVIYADSIGKPIIPLVFPESVVPTLVNHLTWIPFYSGKRTAQTLNYEAGFGVLLGRLNETSESSAARATVDPYHDYLKALYERIIYYLNQTVFSLITLKGKAADDAVEASAQVLPMAFFDMAGIGGSAAGNTSFANFNEAFDSYHGRVLLLGEPGAGKTTALMAFARDATWRRLENPALPLPILAPIATWNPDLHPTLVDWLAQIIPALSKPLLTSLLNNGSALLLFDGLDELGSEREDTVKQEMYDPRQRFLRLIPPRGQVIVSCRVKDYAEIGEKAVLDGALTLQPLDDMQMRDYLQEMPNLWAVLQADSGLREMARTPLLLALFRYAFAGQDALKELRDLRQGDLRDKIFESYVQQRYEREVRKPNQKLKFTLEEIHSILGRVATGIAGWLAAGENVFYPGEFTRVLDETAAQDFTDLAFQLHLLVHGERNTLRFIHLLLRDYFAFSYAISHLLDLTLYDAWGLRSTPARALGLIGDLRAVEPLIHVLEDTQIDAAIRNSVADALGDLKDAQAVPVLLTALNDPDVRVRGKAIIALGKIGDQQAVAALIPLLADSARYLQTYIGTMAARSLIRLDHVAVIIDLLRDDNPVLRETAAWSLGRERIVEVAPQIIPLLADTATGGLDRVCDAAEVALERFATPEALAALNAWRAQGKN